MHLIQTFPFSRVAWCCLALYREAMKGILFRTLRSLLRDMKSVPTAVGYHSNPNNERSFLGPLQESLRIQFEGEDYFARLNTTRSMTEFEILLGHSRGRKVSGNNPDVSFTERHFDPHFLLVVTPSLKRCGGMLSVEPGPIGNFPARVTTTHNRFVIGPPNAALFPCLFKLCLAKKLSIDAHRSTVD